MCLPSIQKPVHSIPHFYQIVLLCCILHIVFHMIQAPFISLSLSRVSAYLLLCLSRHSWIELCKSAFSESRQAASLARRLALQEGAPIDDVENEEREGEEESGDLVDVNGGGSSSAASFVLHRRRPRRTSVPLGFRPHRRLQDERPTSRYTECQRAIKSEIQLIRTFLPPLPLCILHEETIGWINVKS